jgi:peptide/nickel transport system permease protein
VTGYLVRRILQAIVVVLGVTVIAFILQNLVATGPGLARAIIGPRATPVQIRTFIAQYGLNHPVPVQYLHFLWRLLHGNLGYSYKQNQTVDAIIAHELPKDVLLVGTALVLSVLIAVPIGILQAVRRNKAADYVGTTISFLLYSMPSYWLSLILIALFAVGLEWLPAEAPQGATITAVLAHPLGLILPILSLTLVNYALFSRYMRSAAIETLVEDYVRTARAKGVPLRTVLRRHVLRNSLIPVTTMIGLSVPGILTAGLITEYVFNFPGIGLSFYNAAVTFDYPVELGITVLVGVATVAGNFIADVGYAFLDPRVRYD